MKSQRLLAGKGKFICLCLLLLFCFSTTKSFSQNTTINYLTSSLSLSNCNVFLGSPTVNGIVHNSLAGGVTYNNTTGIFLATTPGNTSPGGTAFVINYPFLGGDNYTISIVTNGGDGSVNLFAEVVSSLSSFPTSNNASCTPDNDVLSYSGGGLIEFGGIPSGSKTNTVPPWSEAFNFNYLVIWASGGNTSLSEDGFSISEVIITQSASGSALCTFTAPINLSTSNNGTTLNWVGNGNGNIADLLGYKIAVTDESNGVNYTTNLVSSGLNVNFCPKASGDEVTFTVTAYCIGGSTGTTSAPYSFTYSSSPLSTPNQLSYKYNSNLNDIALSWSAVSGAWDYNVLLQDLTENSGIQTSAGSTTTNGISANALQLINGHVYKAAVIAQNCSLSPQSTWYQFTAGYCTAIDNVSISNIGYNPFQVNVQLAPSGGISPTSYTARLDEYTPNYQIGVSYLYNLTSTSFNMSVPVIGGTYVVNVQSVCGTLTTNWYPSGSPTYIYSVSSPLTQSSDSSIVNPSIQSPTFGLYPVPASSQVNLIYTSTQTGKANIVIVNEIGIPVIRKAISFVIGQNSCSFDITQLANGIYFVKMFDGKNVYIQKLLIQK
jgi:hypothetical protein